MDSKEIESWIEEKQSAYLYKVVARVETDPVKKRLFADLGKAAEEQAGIWSEAAKKKNRVPPSWTPDVRARIVAALIRFLGPRPMKGILAAMKVRGLSVYSAHHGHAMPATIEDVGLKHRGSGSTGNLRAAVFGINDGLVSNTSLILGVAGASADHRMILLAGIAGGIAGAFSMAAGEYVSVKSQREMFEYQIGLEREELREYPKEETRELALIYEARGLPKGDAGRLAAKMTADPEKGLEALAREELGINPEDLVSPWWSALFSFVSFGLGGLIPLSPFLFGKGDQSLLFSVIAAGASLFVVGCLLSLFTGRNALWSGLRMVVIGGGAGALTYLIGTAF